MVELSIIVPVYNVESYLPRCIDSILNQSIKHFELILIDDGSKDNSPAICDEYAEKDMRIKVIHKANEGVSVARNLGLDLAVGEFVGFVDADDYVATNMFDTLKKMIEEYNADIACCDLAFIDEYECIQTGEISDNVILNGEETFAEMLNTNSFLRMGVWNKLYRRKDLVDKRFIVGRNMSEDLLFLMETLLPAEKVVYIRQPMYYYFRQREGAATQKKYGLYEKQRIEATQQLVDIVRSRHASILPQAVSYKCINGDLTALNKMINANVIDKDMIQFVKKDIRKEYKDILFSKLRFQKKLQLLVASVSFVIYKVVFGFKR